jgi:molecular chaperone DnaJ
LLFHIPTCVPLRLGSPNTRGDQYVTVKVTIPNRVSGKEKELIEQLENM